MLSFESLVPPRPTPSSCDSARADTSTEFATASQYCDSAEGRKWFERATEDFYYTHYQTQDWDQKRLNTIAGKILAHKYANEPLYDIFDDATGDGDAGDDFYQHYRSDFENSLESLAEEIEDEHGVSIDVQEWLEDLEERVIERMGDRDDSTQEDLFGSHHRAEVIFSFARPGEESLISCYGGLDKLSIDRNSQRQLCGLGYDIADLRKIWNNQEPKSERLVGRRKRAQPLLSIEQMTEIVDNACNQWFEFVLYAQISLSEILAFNPRKGFILDRYAVGTYNGHVGTFHDICAKEPIMLRPRDGHLRGVDSISPDDVCGLVGSFYTAGLHQTPDKQSRC